MGPIGPIGCGGGGERSAERGGLLLGDPDAGGVAGDALEAVEEGGGVFEAGVGCHLLDGGFGVVEHVELGFVDAAPGDEGAEIYAINLLHDHREDGAVGV